MKDACGSKYYSENLIFFKIGYRDVFVAEQQNISYNRIPTTLISIILYRKREHKTKRVVLKVYHIQKSLLSPTFHIETGSVESLDFLISFPEDSSSSM